MNVMAPTRPTELHLWHVRLTAGPAAAAEARGHVQAAIRAWDVPVDRDVAVLLTSELVTNAIRHEPSETITLAVRCSFRHLRVDVHDTSCSLPVVVEAPGDAETGRGLMLVATLSAEWGFYRTPAGKAVYFTLALGPPGAGGGGCGPQGLRRGDCEPLALPAGPQSPPSPSVVPAARSPVPAARSPRSPVPAARSPRPDVAQCRLAGDVGARMDVELLQDVGDVGCHGSPG
jgi:anti-sigma regulatory factor (Ser/Thr protein kinase)